MYIYCIMGRSMANRKWVFELFLSLSPILQFLKEFSMVTKFRDTRGYDRLHYMVISAFLILLANTAVFQMIVSARVLTGEQHTFSSSILEGIGETCFWTGQLAAAMFVIKSATKKVLELQIDVAWSIFVALAITGGILLFELVIFTGTVLLHQPHGLLDQILSWTFIVLVTLCGTLYGIVQRMPLVDPWD